MGKALFSPKQIVTSFLELFWRSWQWLLWLLTVIVAGAVGIGERFSIHNISNHTWFRIAVGGAVVSLAVAYHRTRLERDEARAGEVERGHGDDLHARISAHIERIERREPCTYDGAPATGADRASFEAHHRELAEAGDRWNTALDQSALRINLHAELSRETGALDSEIWTVDAVFDHIWAWIIGRAEHDELDTDPGLVWSHEAAIVECRMKLSDMEVGSIPEEPHDTLGDRLQEAKKPVDDIAHAALGWPVASEIAAFVKASEALRGPLLAMFSIESQVERVRVTRLCAICRKNQGWPEPKPPLRLRAAERIQRVLGHGSGESA